jgi:hypothetical protein
MKTYGAELGMPHTKALGKGLFEFIFKLKLVHAKSHSKNIKRDGKKEKSIS